MNFCSFCGQDTKSKRASISTLVSDFISTYFSFESKFFVTFKTLILSPGFLSIEYISGKRVKYLSPIRLYIFTSFVFFLLNSFLPETVQNDDEVNSVLDIIIDDKQEVDQTIIDSKDIRVEKNNQMEDNFFENLADSKLPILLFFFIPFLAFCLKLFFGFYNRLFIDHLIFAIHIQTFFFILLILVDIIDSFHQISFIELYFLSFYLFYLIFSAKNFYEKSLLQSILRALGVLLLFLPIVIITFVLFVFFLIKFYDIAI